MKVPLNWLREYVVCDAPPAQVAERLTFAGLEVESLETVGADWKGLVVGEIRRIEPHPNADRLTVCRVFDGRAEHEVVCGARNFSVGDKAPFAGVGCVLPGGQTIQATKLRGVLSHGMLCAEDEIGLSEDHAGILILPRDTPTGAPLTDALGAPEPVLTIEVTPNRPDCLSLIGIAREVAALYGTRLKLPAFACAETGAPIESAARVTVEDTEACPRYTARVLHDVRIGPAPLWMRRRLTQAGVRPINNIVDVTNYVMLECGQPLHAFDLACLEESALVVRRARAGETLATLDGVARALSPDLLVIADARRPVAVAGVMGGAASGITPATRALLLESACFKPAVVRRAVKTLGLASESSYRFERGVDIQLADWASRRAAALMAQCAGGTLARGAIDLLTHEPKPVKLLCRFDRVRRLLGIELADDRIASLFESLALTVTDRDKKACTVQVPTFRPDLEQEADLIEEVARLHGLDHIPTPAPRGQIVPEADDRPVRAQMRCRAQLVGLGLTEIVNYSFVAAAQLDRFETERKERRVALPHPLSADHAVLRDTLLPQMADTLGRNRARQNDAAALFELGRVFFRNAAGAPAEEERLAVGLMGPVGRVGLERERMPTEEDTFLWLKGIAVSLHRALTVRAAGRRPAESLFENGLTFQPLTEGGERPFGFPGACFEPGRGVSVWLDGFACGVLGLLRAALRAEWRFLDPVALMELRVAPLLAHAFETPVATRPPVYPSVRRDLALVVAEAVAHETVARAVWKLAPKELTELRVFDIFRSEQIGLGRKSMAYALTYRSDERTLTDDEVNALHAAVKTGLKRELQAEIREG